MRSHWMSKVSAALTAIFVAAGLATTVSAQGTRTLGRVTVPFNFENGEQHLPSGLYTIGLDSQRILMLRGDKKSSLQMVQPDDNRKPAERSEVVFHRYGNRYILSEVWTAGKTVHLRCPVTKAEKELRSVAFVTPEPTYGQAANSELAVLEVIH